MSLKNDKKNNKKLDKKLDNNNDKISNKKTEKNDSPKEEMTKGEKLFFRILFGIGALLIVLIIIFSIGTGGDKNMIARKYNSITNENVFDMIDYDDLIEKIENKETFQVLVINNKQKGANDYIYYVNEIIRQTNEENNLNVEDNEENLESDEIDKTESSQEIVIYVLDPVYLDKDEEKIFKEIDKSILLEPSLVQFGHNEDTIGDKSVEFNSTDRYFVEDFGGSYWSLLIKYFNDCESN